MRSACRVTNTGTNTGKCMPFNALSLWMHLYCFCSGFVLFLLCWQEQYLEERKSLEKEGVGFLKKIMYMTHVMMQVHQILGIQSF